jgi:penicillin-binding protein 2
VSLTRALTLGCRVWFYRSGSRLGIDRLAGTARALGLGQSSGLGLNNEAAGTVPTTAWFKRALNQPVYPRDLMSVAIGQGQVTVTPLQLAMVYAVIANGGRLYHPRIVLRTERADGSLFRRVKPRLRRKIQISASTLLAIRSGLRQAVAHPKGQARLARVVSVPVAGLAGNGQGSAHGYRHPLVSPHAWFAGYAPAKRPEIAVVVLVQNGGSGNRVAAPIAARILRAYFALGRAKPQIAFCRSSCDSLPKP